MNVVVIEKSTGEVVETIPVSDEREATAVLSGLRINLNHAEYRAEKKED